jgi:hypothetical protein
MKSIEGHAHWQTAYQTKGEHDVSWFEESPAISLELIRATWRSHLIPPPERLESSFWKVRGGNAWADRFHLPRSVIRCAI